MTLGRKVSRLTGLEAMGKPSYVLVASTRHASHVSTRQQGWSTENCVEASYQ